MQMIFPILGRSALVRYFFSIVKSVLIFLYDFSDFIAFEEADDKFL